MARALLAVALVAVALSGVCGAAVSEDHKLVREQIRDILSAPEYNRSFDSPENRSAIEKWLEGAVERLGRWLAGALRFDAGISQTLSAALAWSLLAVLAVLFGILLYKLSRVARVRQDAVEQGSAQIGSLLSSGRLIAEAAASAEAGDFRGAYLRAYLASIIHLDETDLLRFSRSRTNWEHLVELRAKGMDTAADALASVTLGFDRKFYGREACTRADYEAARAAYDQLRLRSAA